MTSTYLTQFETLLEAQQAKATYDTTRYSISDVFQIPPSKLYYFTVVYWGCE